jgi:hypothetical protein
MEKEQENKTESGNIEKHLLDRKLFKKRYRRMFDSYIIKFTLRKFPDDLIKYRKDTSKIMKFLSVALNKDITFDIGNIYFLIGMMNDHMTYMDDCAKRIERTDDYMMPSMLQVIHEKNLKLIEILESNETHPVSITDLEKHYAGDIINDGHDSI